MRLPFKLRLRWLLRTLFSRLCAADQARRSAAIDRAIRKGIASID